MNKSRDLSLAKSLLIVVGLVLLLGLAFGPRLVSSTSRQLGNGPPACKVDTSKLLGLINNQREVLGESPLTVDGTLVKTSEQKLDDMVTRKYYGHLTPDGQEPWVIIRAANVRAALSEELDIDAYSPAMDWYALKNSPEHYKSLMGKDYTRVGISSRCVDFQVMQGTGPDDNSIAVGKRAAELTVIHLATPEPN